MSNCECRQNRETPNEKFAIRICIASRFVRFACANDSQLSLLERDRYIFFADRAAGSAGPAPLARANAHDGAAKRAFNVDVTFIVQLIL
jgi:hypothetical protein